MSDLRDFFQGASNSIASNVSAPVDGIAWLLRKAGVPVPPNPMGGSDWMTEKGLTQQPQNRTAGLLGEFAGMTAPMVAAAKAPQIAKGLLSLDDKAMEMGRSALENHMVKNGLIQPATVWHGSPHKFNKFDSSKIGTGEGAQAYGHGLYLAESPGVARDYAGALSAAKATKPVGNVDLTQAYQNLPNDVPETLLAARRDFRELTDAGELSTADRRDFLTAVKNNLAASKNGQLYKVDLPDEHIAKMLDWDKPLSQQAPEVLKMLTPTWQGGTAKTTPYAGDAAMTGQQLLKTAEQLNGRPGGASNWLKDLGIPGIRYLDGGSRGTGAGTSNYVVFPGNEGLLKILERNGQGLLD